VKSMIIELPSNFIELVIKSMKDDEKNYRYIAHDAKTNEIKLIKSRILLDGKPAYDYCDGKKFGNYIKISRTKNWVYIGLLDRKKK